MPPNDVRILENVVGIRENDEGINDNDHYINKQQNDIQFLQERCRLCQNFLNIDRAALVLYCQQFSFAPDMVEPCA